MAINFNKAKFETSAAEIKQLPEDINEEIAFVGRSNAGKSSALNTITQQKSLAKTSKTPGRTQLINFFHIENNKYLVDLPGYGYAKVSANIKEKWQKTLSKYLETRESLKGIILIMDIRHPFKEVDMFIFDWAIKSKLPVHILLTKADKLTRSQANNTLFAVREKIKSRQAENFITAQLFSSLNKTGLDEAKLKLTSWYNKK